MRGKYDKKFANYNVIINLFEHQLISSREKSETFTIAFPCWYFYMQSHAQRKET